MKAKTTVRKQGYFSRVHKLGENYCHSPWEKKKKCNFINLVRKLKIMKFSTFKTNNLFLFAHYLMNTNIPLIAIYGSRKMKVYVDN